MGGALQLARVFSRPHGSGDDVPCRRLLRGQWPVHQDGFQGPQPLLAPIRAPSSVSAEASRRWTEMSTAILLIKPFRWARWPHGTKCRAAREVLAAHGLVGSTGRRGALTTTPKRRAS